MIGVASLHGLACFPALTMMSFFPCRSAFEQDVEHGNTDGLGDCQSKQGLSLLSFLLYSAPPHTVPLVSVNSVPLFSRSTVSFFAGLTFSCPVCSTFTVISFSLFHPSVPYSSHPLLFSPRCFSGPLVNRVLCPFGQRLSSFLRKHSPNIQPHTGMVIHLWAHSRLI